MNAEYSSGGVLDPGDAMERVAAWRGKIDKLASDTKAMSDRLASLQVTVASDNGLAEVTVDSVGALVDLRLDRRIQRVAPEVVARTIMGSIRTAREKIADRSQEIIAETVGTETTAAQAIAERVGKRLREAAASSRPNEDDDPHRWR